MKVKGVPGRDGGGDAPVSALGKHLRECEYETLRTEMLQRFARVFEAGKLATGGIVSLIALYSKLGVDCSMFLCVLEVLVFLTGLYAFDEYRHIYAQGTYVAVILESEESISWHRMSRRLGEYLRMIETQGGKKTPVSLRVRWGTDGGNFAFVLLILTFVSWLFCEGKVADHPESLLTPWTLVPLGVVFSVVWLLVRGLRAYRLWLEEMWVQYSLDWGNSFPDPYVVAQERILRQGQ